MPDQRPDPTHYDARVEEIQLVLTMAEGLHQDLDPTEPGTQRLLSILIGECQTRITDLRHQQHQEATTGQSTHLTE